MSRRRQLRTVTGLVVAVLGVILLNAGSKAAAASPGEAQQFSAGMSSAAGPLGIASGPDGNVWFAELNDNKIGRITPAGVITEYPTPTQDSGPNYIAAGPDGAMWFTEYGADQIGRITTSGQVSEFPVPTTGSSLEEITAGPDGDLWFTEAAADQIGKIDPSTHIVTEYPAPSGSYPWGITRGPDGNLWFTEVDGNAIGRITTDGNLLPAIAIPTDSAAPEEIVNGPDGSLWFTESANDAIGRVTTAGTVTEFLTPTQGGARPFGIARGPDGNLWFVEQGNGGKVAQITPSGTITEFSTLTQGSRPTAITTGPDDNLWVTENFGEGAIARVQSGVGVTPPSNTTPPQISGSITQGDTLSESHGSWSGSPTHYTYRWEDCDRAGENCTAIPGATGQTYLLAARDVDHTVRVLELASNTEGPGPAASSGQTDVVVATAAKVRTAIIAALTPTGSTAKIGMILRDGGYATSVPAPESGRVTLSWLSGGELIAAGAASFSRAGNWKVQITLTPAGRKLLKRSRSVNLTAKGKFTDTARSVTATKQIMLGR